MISDISIHNFNYHLPDSAVAKYPLSERDSSKLLVWKDHQMEDHQFSELPSLLPTSSLLVFNNTRVIRARLLFEKSTGAKIEIFCLEPVQPHDYQLSFSQNSFCSWKCIIGNRKRWKGEVLEMEVEMERREDGETGRPGDGETGRLGDGGTGRLRDGETERLGDWGTGRLRDGKTERRGDGETGRPGDEETGGRERPGRVEDKEPKRFVLRAELIKELEEGFEVRFSWDHPQYTFAQVLEAAGNIPIPPYLHRPSEEIDSKVYQTVYSKIEGSVAAPTAGLHFTENIFNALANRQIQCAELTLHVGAGTFQPVKSEFIAEHRMHTEFFQVGKQFLEQLLTSVGNIIAVGTTSVRTLESLYWIGCSLLKNPDIHSAGLAVEQWDPYQKEDIFISTEQALQAIINWMTTNNLASLETSTRIMILPGYRFRVIRGLVTNFHQPKSTLLLLISAVLGEDWKRVYTHALQNGYRFLSYGDSNLYLF